MKLSSFDGENCWLWRAVDQGGYVLDEIVQTRRNTKAARRLLRWLLKKQGCSPKRIVTDKLKSYAAARCQLMPNVEHRAHKGRNNRAESLICLFENGSECDRALIASLQRFVSVLSAVRNLFVPNRSIRSAAQGRNHRLVAMAEWRVVAAQIL